MSVHVQSPVWLTEFPRAAMKAIALKLADCANDDGENIYPSVARIARETGSRESTVREVLAAFEESGLVIVVAEATGNRFGRSTTIRRLDLAKLKTLAAVDNRDSTFIPPSHVLKQIDTGAKRENKKGELVPILRWIIAIRSEDDKSAYDDLAPANWQPPWTVRKGTDLNTDLPIVDQNKDACPSGERTPTPPVSGGVPLRSADPTPPVSGPHPSGERTLTVKEPSLELSPSVPQGNERDEIELQLSFSRRWNSEAQAAIREMAGNPVTAHIVENFLAEVCGTLNPPAEVDPPSYVRQIRKRLRDASPEALGKLAERMTETRGRDLPLMNELSAELSRIEAEGRQAEQRRQMVKAGATPAAGKTRQPVRIERGMAPWQPWLDKLDDETRRLAEDAGAILVTDRFPIRADAAFIGIPVAEHLQAPAAPRATVDGSGLHTTLGSVDQNECQS